jgi:hypothetical protein
MSAIYVPLQSTHTSASYSSQGVGQEAVKISELLRRFRVDRKKEKALDDLYEAFSEACMPEWDGHGACRASLESYANAKQFIEVLPVDLPLPEFAVDPDGEISLEWYRSPRRVFSVSMGSGASLSYAGLFGPNRVHGSETFDGGIPYSVMMYIRRLLT